MNKDEYIKYVNKVTPKTNEFKTLVSAFIVGGTICVIGEGVTHLLKLYATSLTEEQILSLTTVIMIFIGSLLTGLGIYEKIGYFAGAGSIIPITGFANSIVSPAMEYNKEGIVYGIMAKMFVISGPVLVTGVISSSIVGIIYYLLYYFGVMV